MDVEVNKIYRHFKGDLYLVVGIAKHSETCEEMVVYRALYGDNGLWVRPKSMFTEKVEGKSQPHRFELVTVPSVREDRL